MNKIFCLKCNQPTCYESRQPVYCSMCQKPYIDTNLASVKPKHRHAPIKEPEYEENEDNSEGYIDEDIPQINDFKVDIEQNLRSNRSSMKSLAGTGKEGIGRPKPKKGKNLSPKQFEKQWRDNFPKNNRNSETDGE